jgi:hypothetical protein
LWVNYDTSKGKKKSLKDGLGHGDLCNRMVILESASPLGVNETNLGLQSLFSKNTYYICPKDGEPRGCVES